MYKDCMIENKMMLKNVYLADRYISRLLGYMFQKSPKYKGILFKPCNSIHTFFMRFSIDVLFLDKDYIVIKKVESLSKGKMVMPIKNANVVIEAMAGTFSGIDIGDKVVLVESSLNK